MSLNSAHPLGWFKNAILLKNRSLKTQMALWVSALFVLASTARIFLAFGYLVGEVKQSIVNQQSALAASIADRIDDKLSTAQQVLLAASLQVTPDLIAHPQKAQLFLESKQPLQTIFTDQLYLFDAKGTLLAGIAAHPDRVGGNFAFREFFLRTVSSRKPVISAPFRPSTTDTQPVIVLTVPIFDSRGNIYSVLAGSLRLMGANFLGELQKTAIGKKGYLYLATASGTIIVHPNPKRILKPVTGGGDQLFRRAVAGSEASGDTVNSAGAPMLTSFRRLRSTDWVVGTNLPADEAYLAVHRTRRLLAAGVGSGTLVMLAMVWLLMHRLTRPLLALTRQVEAMDGGALEPLQEIDSSSDLTTLTLAFNRLIATVRQQQVTLQYNENKYRIVADNTYDWEFWLSPQGCFIYSSPSGKRITGYDDTAFLSDPKLLDRIIHPEDRQLFRDYWSAAVKTATVREIECRLVRSDGEIRWVAHLCQPIYSDSGTYLGIRGNNRDVTEQKRIETELLQSEERYRILVEWSPDAILLHRDGVFIYANDAACRLFGARHPEQLLGMPVLDIVHPESRDLVSKRIMNAMIIGQGNPNHEEKVLRLDGTPIEVEAVGTHLMYQGRAAVQVILRDNTARKQAEQALRESEQSLRTLMEVMPVGVALVGDDARIEYINRCFEEKFGYSQEEIPTLTEWYAGAYRDEAYREEVVAQLDATLARARAEGTPVAPMEVDITCKDGALRHIIVNRELIGNRRIVIFTDITERELLQNELLKAQKLESLGVLAGGIAHDFNNILTGILGNISFARMFLDDSHSSSTPLNNAERAALRAAELATQLLTFAKGGEPVKKTVWLPPLLDESLSLVLRGSSVKAELRIPEALQVIEADEGQIGQAFHNVILNALQAMPDGGILTVSAENVVLTPANREALPPGNYVMLSFADQGGGIPFELQQKIFDPYFTTKAGGNGLGLSSVHSIVNKHGGRVRVASTPGSGTVLTLLLPSVASVSPAPPLLSAPAPAAAGSGARVLIMDDEALILELADRLLGHLGYRVTCAANGEEAIAIYREAKEAGAPFYAAIMDLTVAGAMGGREAARRILALDPAARLVVSSGYSSDPVLAQYRQHGFCAAIAKPYRGADLARVLSALDTTPAPAH